MNVLSDKKTEKVAEIISENISQNALRILVIGCGTGIEAAILAQKLGADVVGVDMENKFDPEAKKYARLEVGDATSLRFPDGHFDLVYSYHVLEHINRPIIALTEMKRVLKKEGGYFVGVPNRSRLVGYIGSKDTTIRQKVRMNISDWKARLNGKFRNEFGAHAGFSASELERLLKLVFQNNENISDIYYMKLYSKYKVLLSFFNKFHISIIAYPSVYFMGSECKLNNID